MIEYFAYGGKGSACVPRHTTRALLGLMKTGSVIKTLSVIVAAVLLAACSDSDGQLRRRAAELCRYIPDHELLEQSKDYMTADFYAVLDTLFNHLPEHEALDHEWLYYFVTGNGGTMADYEVVAVERTDKSHAVATVNVRQQWEDGTLDETSDLEEHHLYMERVDGQWLMSDFDGHKEDCLRHIALNRKEQARRDAICDYLVSQIGPGYRLGEVCIPSLTIVATEEQGDSLATVWGDFWLYWYNLSGDTLMTVSGGSHPGRMTLRRQGSAMAVTDFEQTEDGAGNMASAKRIFGQHYDIYSNIQSNHDVREAVRLEQLREYTRRHALAAHYCQDFGHDAVPLQ